MGENWFFFLARTEPLLDVLFLPVDGLVSAPCLTRTRSPSTSWRRASVGGPFVSSSGCSCCARPSGNGGGRVHQRVKGGQERKA